MPCARRYDAARMARSASHSTTNIGRSLRVNASARARVRTSARFDRFQMLAGVLV